MSDDVRKSGAFIPVSREMVEDHLGFDIEKYPRPPEPTEPEIEQWGDDYWMVVGSDTYEGTDVRGIFRTEQDAIAFWRGQDHRRGLRIHGGSWD